MKLPAKLPLAPPITRRQFVRRTLMTAGAIATAPAFLRGQNRGWVTAEYAMIPRATPERVPREASKGKQGGRTLEIQRLIGRSLRSVTDRVAMGEVAITLDCDVLTVNGSDLRIVAYTVAPGGAPTAGSASWPSSGRRT